MSDLKLQFEKLPFQDDAIESVVRLFEGQESCNAQFSVQYEHLGSVQTEIGTANRLVLKGDKIRPNLQKIQQGNKLRQSESLESMNFTVEMETGTGKTFVYLKTIFELNQKYGFSKFIIVVPSIAIKEGVFKTLHITEDVFQSEYSTYDYFTYDSKKLNNVLSFATSTNIQIMIVNIAAFNKATNIMQREHEGFEDYRPIDYISETKPVVIIDEPQSVDNTAKAKEAIASLNPLFTLRYSATHKEKYNPVYKLDSVDAYEQKLVKQIEVASVSVEGNINKAYIKLLSVNNKKSPFSAKLEIDSNKNGKTKRETIEVYKDSHLYDLSGFRDLYEGYLVDEINCEKGNEFIRFTNLENPLGLAEEIGAVDPDTIKRIQIRKTIEEHLNKELRLNPKGIKVLSLFFLDKVSNYRMYDADNNRLLGKYAKMFEEEYKLLIKKEKYHTLFKEIKDLDSEVSQVHDGYFSIDKKAKNPKGDLVEIYKDTKGVSEKDNDTYNLIMKDKEKLLGFDSKLRFIFSHSALKEGWDNPNVFQICTLNETTTEMKKRQEIGRGLRLAVNQKGKRIKGFEVNTLTVMANESYESFVSKLQNEIEEETGIKFGVIADFVFSNIVSSYEGNEAKTLGQKESQEIFSFLADEKLITKKKVKGELVGKISDELKTQIKEKTLVLPEKFKEVTPQVIQVIEKAAGKLNIKKAADREPIKRNKEVFLSPEFQALWEKIKYKTTYSVDFDSEKLVSACAKALSELSVAEAKFIFNKTQAKIARGGIEEGKSKELVEKAGIYDFNLPDILSYIQNETNLTRKTIADILVKSKQLDLFKKNPQVFIDETIKIIKAMMQRFIVDGIKYHKIGDNACFSQSLFDEKDLVGYLKSNMMESTKSPFNYVVFDSSTIEKPIITEFEKSENVKVYAKLPDDFKIDTPLGFYNPDWAVVFEKEGNEHLYFVVETKGNIGNNRPTEEAKIECGKKHFEAIENEVSMVTVDNYSTFLNKVM